MPQEQDQEFARRLGLRDPQVLYDIDAAYSRHLRGLLGKHCGSGFTEDDVKSIVQDSLQLVWTKFDPKRGSSVKAFYFAVANKKRLSRLRSIGRQAFRVEQCAEEIELVAGETRAPDQRMIEAESIQVEKIVAQQKNTLLDQARRILEPQELRALEFYALKPGHGWAEQLAKEAGGTAKGWRKAKSNAKKKLQPYLELYGVQFSREEGRFEVA